jgi:hypothetical protein
MKNYQVNSKVISNVNNNKDIVVLFSSLIISALLFYFISAPSYRSFLVIGQEIGLKQKNLDNKENLLNNIADFNKNNKDPGVNVDKLKAFIPNRNNYEDFLGHINNLAAADNLQLSNVAIEQKKPDSTTTQAADAQKDQRIKEQNVSFSVSGDLGNFLHFIKILENSIPFIQEQSLSVSLSEKDLSTTTTTVATNQPRQIDLYPSLEYKVAFKFVYY